MTVFKAPRFILEGLSGLDQLISEVIYCDPDGVNYFATINTGFEHELPGSPFTFRAYSWADCVSEPVERFAPGVPYGYCIDPDCVSCLPQFYYPRTDLKMWWYKHVNRVPEINREVGRREWEGIIGECKSWVLDQEPRDPYQEEVVK